MLQHSTTSHIPCTAAWAASRLYSTLTPSWQTPGILFITWEKLPFTPWIMLMQQQQEYSNLIYCLWKISEKCYLTLKKHYLQPCIYQFHQIYSISTDTYAAMSWLQMNNSNYSSMYPYRIMHNNLKYMMSLIWVYLTETSQHTTA